jgi:D-beta-D-heptose 7-phosphate kinase / D-beta-D-heptose 1-phosphate adenosyltransferase
MNAAAVPQAWRDQVVVVVGDPMLDGWLAGRATRLAREAPIPVVQLEQVDHVCGGAANTAANLAALGARPVLIGFVGDDADGALLRDRVRAAGIVDELITVPGRRSLTKRRVTVDGQLLARFDDGDAGPPGVSAATALMAALSAAVRQTPAAVVVCDYQSGSLGPGVRAWLTAHRDEIAVLSVDAHELAPWRGTSPTVVTPSYEEARRLLGDAFPQAGNGGRAASVLAYREALLDYTGAAIVAVTLDVDGALILCRGLPAHRTVAQPVRNSDATGAGDAYTAGFTLALAAGADAVSAAEVAQCCATAAALSPGTGVCTAEALTSRLQTGPADHDRVRTPRTA